MTGMNGGGMTGMTGGMTGGMTIDEIRAVIAAKREHHPELGRRLSWAALRRILARENVGLFVVPLPPSRPAQLVPYAGAWGILINSAAPARWHTYYGAHELGHLWLHHDRTCERWERVYNMGDEWAPDPREDDAELFAMMVCGRKEVREFRVPDPPDRAQPSLVANVIKTPREVETALAAALRRSGRVPLWRLREEEC